VWDQSFQGAALIYGKFDRSITVEKHNLGCVNGVWQIVPGSEDTSIVSDSSEWVRVFQEAQDRGGIASQDVADKIGLITETVNSQPGADTRPFHKYTVTDL
jgi:hypothetical protein